MLLDLFSPLLRARFWDLRLRKLARNSSAKRSARSCAALFLGCPLAEGFCSEVLFIV